MIRFIHLEEVVMLIKMPSWVIKMDLDDKDVSSHFSSKEYS